MGIGGALLPDDAVDPHQHLHGPEGARPGHRDLGRRRGIGIAVGPIAGGLLLEHFWWGSVFLVNVPVASPRSILPDLLVPTSKDPSTPRLDPIGAALSMVGLAALL